MKFLKFIFSPIYYAMAGFSFTISSLQMFLCNAVIKIVNIKKRFKAKKYCPKSLFY